MVDARTVQSVALVVFGLARADFYARALEQPSRAAVLNEAPVVVGPMTGDELAAAVQSPARAVGGNVDDALVDLVSRTCVRQRAMGLRRSQPGDNPLCRLPPCLYSSRTATYRRTRSAPTSV